MLRDTDAALGKRLTKAYEKHAADIFYFCFAKINNRQEAEDLMQEAFLRTWEYLRNGNSIDNLRTFLFRVAENLIVDQSRKKKNLSLDILQQQGFDPGHEPVEKVRQSLDVEKILLATDKQHEYRLLAMRYIQGLRPVDIASQTGETPNTVAVRLHRAMQKLTKKFFRSNHSIRQSTFEPITAAPTRRIDQK